MSNNFTCNRVRIQHTALFLLLSCLGVFNGADAQEQKLTCSREIAVYCQGVKPGGGRLIVCLKEHEKDLASDCREKVAEIGKRLEEAKQLCAGDTEKFCKGIKPGEGRIAKCLNEYIQDISPDCRGKLHVIKQVMQEKKSEQ